MRYRVLIVCLGFLMGLIFNGIAFADKNDERLWREAQKSAIVNEFAKFIEENLRAYPIDEEILALSEKNGYGRTATKKMTKTLAFHFYLYVPAEYRNLIRVSDLANLVYYDTSKKCNNQVFEETFITDVNYNYVVLEYKGIRLTFPFSLDAIIRERPGEEFYNVYRAGTLEGIRKLCIGRNLRGYPLRCFPYDQSKPINVQGLEMILLHRDFVSPSGKIGLTVPKTFIGFELLERLNSAMNHLYATLDFAIAQRKGEPYSYYYFYEKYEKKSVGYIQSACTIFWLSKERPDSFLRLVNLLYHYHPPRGN